MQIIGIVHTQSKHALFCSSLKAITLRIQHPVMNYYNEFKLLKHILLLEIKPKFTEIHFFLNIFDFSQENISVIFLFRLTLFTKLYRHKKLLLKLAKIKKSKCGKKNDILNDTKITLEYSACVMRTFMVIL